MDKRLGEVHSRRIRTSRVSRQTTASVHDSLDSTGVVGASVLSLPMTGPDANKTASKQRLPTAIRTNANNLRIVERRPIECYLPAFIRKVCLTVLVSVIDPWASSEKARFLAIKA